MVNQYHSLFSSLGVQGAPAGVATQGFSHPIPEENEKMTREFFMTMQTLKSTMMQFKKLTLTRTRIQNTTATFVFESIE